MRTSFMRCRVVFAVISVLFFISAFLFPQYAQAVEKNVSTYEDLKSAIDEGTGELIIHIKNDIELEEIITIPDTSGLTKLTIIGENLGSEDNKYILDGKDESGFLVIDNYNLDVEIRNLTIQNCKSIYGSVIYARRDDDPVITNILLVDSIFQNNHATENAGGVIDQDNGTIIIDNCVFENNKTDGENWYEVSNGGAINQAAGSTLIIINSTFSRNESNSVDDASSDGGAINQGNNCNLTIINSVFENNYASSQGGAIWQGQESTLEIDPPNINIVSISQYTQNSAGSSDEYSSHFILNTANDGSGGAIATGGKEIRIFNTKFDRNQSKNEQGGAIYSSQGYDIDPEDFTFVIEGCLFEENNAPEYFGGAISYDLHITVNASTFTNNSAYYGGALYNEAEGNATIDNSVFTGNHAQLGGVFFHYDYGTTTVSDSVFTENYAVLNDAIIFTGLKEDQDGNVSFPGIASFTGNTFTDNTVKDENGWVFTLRGAVTIEDNEFYANTNKKRDMLFADATRYPAASDDDTISVNNYYRGNYLEDRFSSPESGDEITYSEDIEVELELREVYNNKILDGNVKITINGTPYPEIFAVENGTAHLKIKRSALKDGTNEITAEYVSDEYKDEEGHYVSGYYHYQPAYLTFKIRKTTVIYTVTVIDDGNGNASAEPASGEEGDTVTLTAMPKEGYKFKEWQIVESGGGSLDGNIFTIGAGNAVIKAIFEEDKNPEQKFTVTVTTDGNGTAFADPTSGPTGTEVLLTAQPDDGWEFKEWNVIEPGGGTLQSQKAAGASETAVFIIGTADAEIQAVFEKSEEPQPPVPPRPEPVWPPFFRLNDELPKTGITGSGAFLTGKPASVNYKPVNMELQIPSLYVTSDIVTVPVTDDGYAVAWLGNNAGLLEGSALPGEGVSVIAGHNTLNAEEFGPFAAIRQLDEGERFFVRDAKGKLMTYVVYANEKIGSADADALQKYALTYDNTLTLLTCEDELPEGGYASRRIVSAKYIN